MHNNNFGESTTKDCMHMLQTVHTVNKSHPHGHGQMNESLIIKRT